MTLSKARLAALVVLAALAGWFLNDALSASPKRRPSHSALSNLLSFRNVRTLVPAQRAGEAQHPQAPARTGHVGPGLLRIEQDFL